MDVKPLITLQPTAPKALLVGVDMGQVGFDPMLEELGLLAQTAGFEITGRLTCKRQQVDAAYFVGTGKVQEIKQLAQSLSATEVLFDQALSPAQQRNLERALGLPVNDRTLLILDIFAQRARSHEGKLQVELARLQYLSTRLVRRWTHLERQSGGIGMRGGPGETQIELDRRMLTTAITRTRERLRQVKKNRATQRKARQRRGVFTVSLVGYTNAGKSSLFNALLKTETYAADQLFATLDTTTRELYLPQAGCTIAISDTVGFIRDLPHHLVAAFEATLQEAADADLLLHVVDFANPNHWEQIQAVHKVLQAIGAMSVDMIQVFNKLDAVDELAQPAQPDQVLYVSIPLHTDGSSDRRTTDIPRVFISCQTGVGLDQLRAVIAKRVLATSILDS